jgi:hypothetical protein
VTKGRKKGRPQEECVCVCVCGREREGKRNGRDKMDRQKDTQRYSCTYSVTHTHTHIHAHTHLTRHLARLCPKQRSAHTPAIGTPASGPEATVPYTSALLAMRGSMLGGTPKAARVGSCHCRVLRSMRLVRQAFVTVIVAKWGGG